MLYVINQICRYLLIQLLISLMQGIPILYLWNYCLIGTINGVNEINYMKAVGISLLSNILIKSDIYFNREDE
jgi:hypothetical protein